MDARGNRPRSARREESFHPPVPQSIEETGLNLGFLSDLALKTMYYEGYISGRDLAESMKLPYAGVVDQVLEFLKREQFCEVKGTEGFGEQSYQYAISGRGSEKAREVMERSQYVGPAPVTLSAYSESVKGQTIQHMIVNEQVIRQALSHLVISDRIFNQIGPAVNSARSIFLFGHPGNGKTAIAESIGYMMLQGNIYMPYAIEVGGLVINVFDRINHRPVEVDLESHAGAADLRTDQRVDKRWVKVRRPVVTVGGELTLESLDLVFDKVVKIYEAPFQMKANGGMFLVDDFGRQQVRPRDLLNRWIVPLEKRIDYLTLHTGQKIEVPFDSLIVFATNLEPRDLVDEAFLRRIRHKIAVTDPSFEEYREIFRQVCEHKGVPYDHEGLAYLLKEYYIKPKAMLRACHPRDLVDEIIDIARYLDIPPTLSRDLIDRACESYFVKL